MKKILLSISFICYLAVSCGVTIHSHFCMKKLVSVHLFEKKSKLCSRCGMDLHDESGCCRDEIKLVKLDQDQNKLIFVQPGIAALEPLAITPSEFIIAPFISVTGKKHFLNHSPPLLGGQDLYIENSVFRI